MMSSMDLMEEMLEWIQLLLVMAIIADVVV